MRTLLTLVAALVALFFAQSITAPIVGWLSLPLGFAAAIAVFFVLKGNSQAGATSIPAGLGKKYPAGFTASFAHDNIAIDEPAGKIWLRGKGGYSAVLSKSEILRWNVAYISNGPHHLNNRLEIHVRDLNRPKCEVAFRRHSDAWKWSAARNAQEAEEWASRLTTWVNNS